MQTVVIVVHLMIVAVLIGAVLLQKSEGGGLGMGGGAGFMSSRGTANLLTRMTAILAAGFFVTSLFLAWAAVSRLASRFVAQSSWAGKSSCAGQRTVCSVGSPHPCAVTGPVTAGEASSWPAISRRGRGRSDIVVSAYRPFCCGPSPSPEATRADRTSTIARMPP